MLDFVYLIGGIGFFGFCCVLVWIFEQLGGNGQ